MFESTRLDLLRLIGKFVRVTALSSESPVPTWHIEEPFLHRMEYGTYEVTLVEDWCLTPLRGESASDKTTAHVRDPLTILDMSEA
ncbi:hypothetical protein PQR39_26370 [Paraburkholderia sediminicola]|uniref:hypothetical protein n=1 Tax=Paraburkholderia sediminicola TaxID=458836 RepID=UPI0038B8A095